MMALLLPVAQATQSKADQVLTRFTQEEGEMEKAVKQAPQQAAEAARVAKQEAKRSAEAAKQAAEAARPPQQAAKQAAEEAARVAEEEAKRLAEKEAKRLAEKAAEAAEAARVAENEAKRSARAAEAARVAEAPEQAKRRQWMKEISKELKEFDIGMQWHGGVPEGVEQFINGKLDLKGNMEYGMIDPIQASGKWHMYVFKGVGKATCESLFGLQSLSFDFVQHEDMVCTLWAGWIYFHVKANN